jgi:hypothetical protein
MPSSPVTEAFVVSCSHCCGDMLILDGETGVCLYCRRANGSIWQPSSRITSGLSSKRPAAAQCLVEVRRDRSVVSKEST